MSWCTIESDPAVFNELVETFGTKGVEFAELWGLDDESLASLEPIYGMEKSGGESRERECGIERAVCVCVYVRARVKEGAAKRHTQTEPYTQRRCPRQCARQREGDTGSDTVPVTENNATSKKTVARTVVCT